MEGTNRIDTLLCLLDFESSALFLQVNQNENLNLIFGAVSIVLFTTSLKRKSSICSPHEFPGPSKSSGVLITPFLSLHHVPFHSLACRTGMFFSTFHMIMLYVCVRIMGIPEGLPRKAI